MTTNIQNNANFKPISVAITVFPRPRSDSTSSRSKAPFDEDDVTDGSKLELTKVKAAREV